LIEESLVSIIELFINSPMFLQVVNEKTDRYQVEE
jgi:hypothetical protein